MKSGERTDKADGHIQDRPRFLTGSKVSPPTHPKTNKFCDPTVRYRIIHTGDYGGAARGCFFLTVMAGDGDPTAVEHHIITSGMCPLHCRMMYDYGY